ncbi:MAG: 4Fe-4S dicluster domain-containing protein [Proteobacteria bacterium]|nr:4Fe-4S dicluster domain-containing protein [Pseudomonadota bacterium]MBU1687046.1 4Fe-4S dicluster domain-containing protein [Pseudomonadota bacterium]
MERFNLLKKDHLIGFLRKLAKEYRIIAPVKNRHGDTLFTPVTDLDNDEIDLTNQPQNSIKSFLFPQTEVIATYQSSTPDDYTFTEPEPSFPPTIFFGVRPCDLSAILYMDVIFLKGKKDPFFLDKRRNSLLIGLNCTAPFANCFCNATNSGPFLEFGFDLQFTDLGDRFMVETGRSSGERLIEDRPQFFTPSTEKDSQARYQSFLEARGGFHRPVHLDQTLKKLAKGEVDESVWSFLSERCQDCGGCAYVCPTCTCFTISDQPLSPTNGERLRSWDACTFSGFTRMAGGHNPVHRATGAIRQRFLHKLLYDVKQHGRTSCVGCGRCVGICFGGTDIVRFINMSCQGELYGT